MTQITYPATSAAHIEKFSYNFASGELASSTDQNNNATSYDYNDSLGRLTETAYPDGGETLLSYDDSPGSVSVTATKKINSSENYVSVSLMDGVGHVTETQLTSDPAGADFMDSAYDGEGLVWKQSNPYRSQSDSTYGITTSVYDALGRVTSITRPDGNVAGTSYSGNCSTGTDEAGKARETCSDGLGRLSDVYEDPSGLNYHTHYAYDALGNLLTVNQGGQTRSFVYDSLSRELSATNPESGTTTYAYDANGNVATRVAPLQNQTGSATITTTYAYDALNRLLSKTYSDTSLQVLFGYDQTRSTIGSYEFNVTNGIGRLSYAWHGVNQEYSYDPMGRITGFYQCVNCSGAPWITHYTYNLAGDVYTFTHPAGPMLTYNYDGAEHVASAGYSPSDTTHPATLASVSYTPFGAVNTMTNCSSTEACYLQETYDYNNRLQPVRIQLGTTSNSAQDYCLVYNYYASVGSPSSCAVPSQGSGDNGNVMGFLYQDNVNNSLTHTESYTYDSVNRLTNAVATGGLAYNLTFAYDPHGNATCQTNGNTLGYCDNLSFNANNQITTSGFSYDAAGNMTTDNFPGAYTFDEEGHVTNDNGSAITRNAYGWDVEELGGQYQEEQIYDPQGNELGSYGATYGNWDYVYLPLGPRILAVTSPSGCCGTTGTTFLHANNLNSTTIATDYAGNVAEDLLLYPWGYRWTYTGTLNDEHFAGLHNGDGLKQSPTRTYASPIGRWLTPDPDNSGADPSNPQSWNAYAYALNNPATNTDPSGLMPTVQGPLNECQITGGGLCDQPSPGLACRLNGVSVPCGMAEGELGSGFAAECPGGACSGFGTDPYTGQAAFLQFTTGAGGASGYLSAYDYGQGVNNVNAAFLSDAQYAAYIQATFRGEIGQQQVALAAKVAAHSNISYQQALGDLGIPGGHLQGGNYNFVPANGLNSSDLTCDSARCNGVHFTSSGFVHLDTTNPWSGFRGFLNHAAVDVFLGNTVFSGGFIPRPFP